MLPKILSNAGPLPAKHARDGEQVLPGRIYVARPDHHLTLHDGNVRVAETRAAISKSLVGNNKEAAKVAGLVIGSPEFQRR